MATEDEEAAALIDAIDEALRDAGLERARPIVARFLAKVERGRTQSQFDWWIESCAKDWRKVINDDGC